MDIMFRALSKPLFEQNKMTKSGLSPHMLIRVKAKCTYFVGFFVHRFSFYYKEKCGKHK